MSATANSPRVLLVDAYDSFSHIIDQYLLTLGARTEVVRSHTRTPQELVELRPDAVVLGPGPGHPADSGHVQLVHAFAGRVPLLGVCLGHQAIGLAFGAEIAVARNLMHGKTSPVRHDGRGVFEGVAEPLTVTRYHSLILDGAMPPALEVTATSLDDGYVMGVRHRTLAVEGVQFHPESVMTSHGLRLFENFLAVTRRSTGEFAAS
ncbi:aminodeoxychorismate/anthranilate synthase component II [Streptomyces sp. SCA3-4]|uniref:anthranilate synthase component II n=1 Tax=Streptomyces sichuanensis TaxID=2871810 RepID=UPI001CE38852|nr:aminodeoxychorismate/anthranilate synthase component II [Streptomyces sichuanensis]MCA6095472.1 aminodeoxychorismate/anthranilate synthase component II [Streptomyces sichuanensis]